MEWLSKLYLYIDNSDKNPVVNDNDICVLNFEPWSIPAYDQLQLYSKNTRHHDLHISSGKTAAADFVVQVIAMTADH